MMRDRKAILFREGRTIGWITPIAGKYALQHLELPWQLPGRKWTEIFQRTIETLPDSTCRIYRSVNWKDAPAWAVTQEREIGRWPGDCI